MLREQLDQATAANQSLTSDIHKLTQDWQAAREELDIKEREWRDEEQVNVAIIAGWKSLIFPCHMVFQIFLWKSKWLKN